MNKRIYLSTVILLVAVLVSGCGFQVVTGSGNVVSETRQVGDFSRFTLAGIGDVYFTQAENVSVRVEAEDNLIPYFEIAVHGDTLTIGLKSEYMGINLHPIRPIKFYVTAPRLDAVTLAGSGNIFTGDVTTTDFRIDLLGSGDISTGKLDAASLDIKLSGSGNISLDSLLVNNVTTTIAGSGNIRMDTLGADTISSSIVGSGKITVSGMVTEQHIEILGSGDYYGSGLQSESASVRVVGSGDSYLSVSQGLNVTILGSGDVSYSGRPRMNITNSGSGNVTSTGG